MFCVDEENDCRELNSGPPRYGDEVLTIEPPGSTWLIIRTIAGGLGFWPSERELLFHVFSSCFVGVCMLGAIMLSLVLSVVPVTCLQ